MTAAMEEKQVDDSTIGNAAAVIERFGGIRPMAAKMAIPVTTVQGWKKRGVIPGSRRDDILRAAASNNIDIADIIEIIEKGAANENEGGFGAAVARAAQAENDEKHLQAVTAGRITMEQEEALMKKLKESERRAVQKSALVSAIMIVIASAMAVIFLWPSQARIAGHEKRIGVIEKEMPSGGWKETFSAIREQAAAMQEKIAALAAMVETLANPDGGPLSQRLGALEEQVQQIGAPEGLAALLEKIRTLQATAEGQQQLAGTVAGLNEIITGLQGRMEGLESALHQAQEQGGASAANGAANSDTGGGAAIGQTLEGVPPADLKAAALLVGLSQFRAALKRNAPFEEDLALLQKMTGSDDPEMNAAIERLAPQAKQGVLSPQGLSDELRRLSGDIVVASLKGEDVSLREKAMARLNDMLQIQKDGQPITGTDTQASIARAQKMLDDGNIEGAIGELQTLQGGAGKTAQPWMDHAQAALLAQQVQDMLTAKVSSALGAADLKSILNGIENAGAAKPVDFSR